MNKKKYTNGIHDISSDEYHSSEGFSRSQLMAFKQTPYHFWYEHLSGLHQKEKPSNAMIFGNLVHTMVLEPQNIPLNYIVIPKCDRRTKEGKIIFDQFMERKAKKQEITQEQYDEARQMALSVMNNDVIAQLLEETKIEQSIYFNHQSTGIQCKVRPDAWLGAMAFDLKTTDSAIYKNFQSSSLKYGYFLQAAMNYKAFESIGIELEEFIFLPVEKKKPYATSVDRCLKEDLDYGFNLFDEVMTGIAKCFENNKWPSYGIRELKVPKYALYDELVGLE